MNGADILICVVMLVSIVAGLWRGFVREAISLVFLVGGIFAAWQIGPSVEPHLGGYLAQPTVRPWVARLLVFIVVLIAGAIVGTLSSYLMRSAGLAFVDRAIGFLFGALRGAVVVGLLVMFGELVHLNHESWWSRSRLIPYGQMVGGWVRTMVGDAGDHWARDERA
ncbi:MAG TPA: CvpA family protein, partial [Steroidobacteraceae bacterium]|nr:CvpA family protein [Steroidobacteraceae bacterium]